MGFDLRVDAVFVGLQKAIMECDEEWAMNKKVVELSSKDIRHSVRLRDSLFCLLLLSVISTIFLVLSDSCTLQSVSTIPCLFFLCVIGSSRFALFCRGLWTSGRVCSRHRK